MPHDPHECDEHEHHGHNDHDDHGGHDDHGHSGHDHHDDLRFASRRSLLVGPVLITTYMIAEIVGGLALVADAGHMATDAAAIALALLTT